MPRKHRDPAATTIICRTCQIEKPLDAFRPKRQECSACEKQRMKNRRTHIREQRELGLLPDVDVATPTRCLTCGETKPLGEFRKNKNSLTGYMQPCATCTVKQVTAYHQGIKKKRNAGELPEAETSQLWTCTHCGETKPMHEFMGQQHTKSGYAQPCKKCMGVLSNDYAKRHPGIHRIQYANNRDHILEKKKAWNKANPDKMRSVWATRRARKRNAYVEKVDYAVLYERDKGVCQLCYKRVTKKNATIDHIQPLALGGEHSYRNCQLACAQCNNKKLHTGKGDQMRLF